MSLFLAVSLVTESNTLQSLFRYKLIPILAAAQQLTYYITRQQEVRAETLH